MVHTQEKPEQCRVCTRVFSQRATMLKHMRTFHPDTPLPPPKDGTSDDPDSRSDEEL